MLSVVIPNYNHGRYLSKALDEIFNQFRRPDEVIVLDDCSTDNSVEIIKRYPEVTLIQNPVNLGVVANLNKGIMLAKGDFIHCHGADDYILLDFYERSLELLERYPAGLCSTLSYHGDFTLFPSRKVKEGFITPKEARRMLWRGSWFMGNTTIYRASVLKALGGFPESLKSYSDNFVQDLIASNYGACFIPAPLAVWRRDPKGFSARTFADKKAMEEVIDNAAILMRDNFSKLYIWWWKMRQGALL